MPKKPKWYEVDFKLGDLVRCEVYIQDSKEFRVRYGKVIYIIPAGTSLAAKDLARYMDINEEGKILMQAATFKADVPRLIILSNTGGFLLIPLSDAYPGFVLQR